MRNTSTTNKAQRDYMTAKALLQTLEEREAEIEKAYIVANGIQNADGTIPERIYCIEDMETFDKANAETAAEVEGCGLWGRNSRSKGRPHGGRGRHDRLRDQPGPGGTPRHIRAWRQGKF